jgi:hypothetical protein
VHANAPPRGWRLGWRVYSEIRSTSAADIRRSIRTSGRLIQPAIRPSKLNIHGSKPLLGAKGYASAQEQWKPNSKDGASALPTLTMLLRNAGRAVTRELRLGRQDDVTFLSGASAPPLAGMTSVDDGEVLDPMRSMARSIKKDRRARRMGIYGLFRPRE